MAGDFEKFANCSHGVIENHNAGAGPDTWRKRLVVAIAFAVLFHLVDSATAFAQKSAAAPAFYLPVGLAIALVLWGGPKYWPLVLFCELLGALFNYQRALFSWCGIPGVIGVYIFYAAGLSVVRRRWPVDVALGTVTDVGRITFIFLSSAAPTAVVGALTLLGDGIIARPAFTKTAINWWESDAISILTFTPMLLLYVVPAVDIWMNHTGAGKVQPGTGSHLWPTAQETSELAAQATAIAAALWLVFRFPSAIPYQPLYVLFIPVIWISVRHGLRGASLATFTVNCGAMFLADANHSEVIGLPRLQLAMLTLALTGLCVGAVVTERRRVEKALARSEFSLSRAQSVARVGSWNLDLNTDELLWSEETYRIFQIPMGTPMAFASVRKMFHPEDQQAFQSSWDAALASGTYDFEHRIEIRGVTKWLRGCAEIQRDAAGRPVAAIGTVQDVTERRMAEEALREAEEKYRSIFEDAAVGMYQSDQGRLLTVNRALAGIFGYESPEKMLKLVSEIPRKSSSGRNLREEFCHQLKSSGMVRDFEYQALRADGLQIWLLENVRQVRSPEGQTLFVEGAIHDISRRKLLEAQLQQSQKMEAIGRLAGGVAHDFNNALSVMMGYSELVQLGLKADDPLQPKLEEILKAADRAASLTRQLLAFSRKQSIRPIVLDLDVIVVDTEKMLRRLIGENINLSVLRGSHLKNIRADKGQIEQALMNLVVNARDAMPRGGCLIIETKNVDVNERSAQHVLEKWELCSASGQRQWVRNEQRGPSSRLRTVLYDQRGRKGTGLGLSTVYAIVKQSDGYLLVDSEVGVGTTFSVYLPQAQGSPALTPPATEFVNIPSGTETVLLVEDEDSLRTLVQGCLEKRGYSVLHAGNGQEALNEAQKHPGTIHLLLTDVIMPGMSGRELADSLKQARPDIKVLYVSGYTHDLVTQQGILETGCELLQKPFSIHSLMTRVRQILDGAGHPQARST